ncbi:MAG: hypothetical protein PHD21_00095 [Flavobacteriales bacterium]|nr:hypothetical protein [Flavobacteriales bacterium]
MGQNVTNADENVPIGMSYGADNKEIIYTKYAQGGITLQNNGYSLSFRRLHTKSAFFEHGYEVDLSLIRNPKEVQIRNGVYYGYMGYCFGKENTHFNLRVGYGLNKEIADKADLGAVEINYFICGGISLAMLKPVYLYVVENDGIEKRRYDPSQHPQSVIVGGTWFFNGLGEMSFHPGVYARVGINFDYAVKEKSILAVEAGVVVDYYFSKLHIMSNDSQNLSLYNAFYVSFYFGRKWN